MVHSSGAEKWLWQMLLIEPDSCSWRGYQRWTSLRAKLQVISNTSKMWSIVSNNHDQASQRHREVSMQSPVFSCDLKTSALPKLYLSIHSLTFLFVGRNRGDMLSSSRADHTLRSHHNFRVLSMKSKPALWNVKCCYNLLKVFQLRKHPHNDRGGTHQSGKSTSPSPMLRLWAMENLLGSSVDSAGTGQGKSCH